jgi:hypothetical protein
MSFARDTGVLAALIGCLGGEGAAASEAAAQPRRLSVEVVAQGSRVPFEDAVVAIATRRESGAWYSAGRMRTDAAGGSSLEIDAAVTAVHVLVVCAHGDRVLSGDAALDLSRSSAPELALEVAIEFDAREAVLCSPAERARADAPGWPQRWPVPRIPRLPPPDPGRCDPGPCPIAKADPA